LLLAVYATAPSVGKSENDQRRLKLLIGNTNISKPSLQALQQRSGSKNKHCSPMLAIR
jgi:hypothetical protein